MRLSFVVAIGCLSTVIPLASGSGQTGAPQPLDWSFSLGVDPTTIDTRGREPGIDARLVANLTRSWQSKNSRFGRHVSLMVGTDLPYRDAPRDDECYGCASRISKRYAGLTAGGSFDVARISRFTPYLKTAVGVYYDRLGLQLDPRATPPGTDPRYFRSGFSFGGNAGLGIKARFGSREFFIEQVLHAFDLGLLDVGVYPLNIGFRF